MPTNTIRNRPYPRQNQLLSALTSDEFNSIEKKLDCISLSKGQVLYEVGDKIPYAYFPTSAIVSRIYTMEDGSTFETGMAASNGFIGLTLIMGGDTLPHRAVVQISGEAFRMRAKDLRAEFARGGRFQKILLLYMQAVFIQISQIAACSRLHSVQQQLSRWLLNAHDRFSTPSIGTTHENMGTLLGVRREGISAAAAALEDAGYIECSRGKVKIIDRKGLERFSCECYRAMVDEYTRLLGKYIDTNGKGTEC